MQEILSLNGEWSLYFHVEQGELPQTIDEVKLEKWPRIQATVPGNVELDLMRAGIEKDPFYAENLYHYRKYEFYQWWFEKDFVVPVEYKDKDILLKLHGLDTFGTIWINEVQVGTTDNMMIEHELDITNHVKLGQINHIAIRIQSSINKVRNKEFPINVFSGEHHDEFVWLRKPPHSFGWDIAPRLLSAGIWRDIEIVARDQTYIKDLYIATQQIVNNKAKIVVRYRFHTDKTYIDDFSVRIKGICGDHSFEKELKTKFCSDGYTMEIVNPKLWWPRGYGDANLYQITFELLDNGKVVDRKKETIGLRTIDIQTSYEEHNAEFKIFVNGVPIMAKGTNWVPLDALHSRDASRLQQAHDMLVDLECNIVRCWGGNVYEDHEFFNLCDQRGILVWQDFAMACAVYPQNEEFYEMIREEAASVIRKLRNHPSILLWAGDNEIDQMYYHFGYHLSHARYNQISREVLPNVVGSHDPFRIFLPSSPYIPEHMVGDLTVPEQHNWGPRDYFKGEFYKGSSAHFISEIGYHGCPSVTSIKKFISPEHVWPFTNNREWDTHNTDYLKVHERDYNRNQLMGDQVEILFGHIPDSLEEFALASQISQAEAKKFFIEMVRLKKWRRTGLIWWNLLDCWPQISDAIVDYYFSKKLAYHFIKRVQNPICLMMTEIEQWNHKLILANDSNQSEWVKYQLEDGDSGEILLSGNAYSKANENLEVGALRSKQGQKKFYILRWTYNQKEHANHYVSGFVPHDFEQYKKWLKKIEALPTPFNSEECFK